MRSKAGMRFDRCIGLQDRDDAGMVFDANVLTCHDKPLKSGESIRVAGRAYRYDGDDNLGNSIFIATEPFPQFETIEEPYKDGLFIVLELYPITHDGLSVSWASSRPARKRSRQALKLGKKKSMLYIRE